jgi:hypothetical protein
MYFDIVDLPVPIAPPKEIYGVRVDTGVGKI